MSEKQTGATLRGRAGAIYDGTIRVALLRDWTLEARSDYHSTVTGQVDGALFGERYLLCLVVGQVELWLRCNYAGGAFHGFERPVHKEVGSHGAV